MDVLQDSNKLQNNLIYSILKEQKEQNIKYMACINFQQFDQQSLYKQFLNFIKKSEKKPVCTEIQKQYKKLYSDLYKSNNIKKTKLLSVQNQQINMKISGCKFTKIEGGIRQLNTIKDSIIKYQSRIAQQANTNNKNNKNNNNNSIQDCILVQQSQKKLLQQQIDNYKIGISLTGKKINQIKQQIKIIDLQQKKFGQAYHLANNILQFTDQFNIINNRNYNKMLHQHQQILNKLKKMRIKVKNQLTQTQYQYQIQQKQQDIKCKKLIKSCIPLQQQQHQQQQQLQNNYNYNYTNYHTNTSYRKYNKLSKNQRKFMQYIEKVLIILQQNEQNFETIKQQQCTKLASKKLNIELLPIQKIQFMKQVQQFEKNYQIRVQSSDKIIIKLYKQIKYKNQQIQKRIFQLKQQLQDSQQQFQQLLQKRYHSNNNSNNNSNIQIQIQQLCNNKKIQKQRQKQMYNIRINSILFVQIIQVINSLLLKFRYIFKLFIMMNIDKRKLSDHLLKLDQLLDVKGKCNGYRFSDNILISNSNSNGNGNSNSNCLNNNNNIGYNNDIINSQDTNLVELGQMLSHSFGQLSYNQIQDLLLLYFNDMRFALICRKAMILEQLQEKESKNKQNMQQLIKILQTIRDQCQYSYNQKLKSSLKILQDCLKSSIKTTNQNLANSSRTYISSLNHNKTNFLTTQLHLPVGMFFKTNKQQKIQQNDQFTTENHIQTKWIMENFINNQKDKPQQWGKQQKKNPSSMIRKLLAIRNQSTKKFKLLDLHECQKKYLKNDIQLVTQNIIGQQRLSDQPKQQKQQKGLISFKNLCDHPNSSKPTQVNNKNQQRIKISPSHERLNNFINQV